MIIKDSTYILLYSTLFLINSCSIEDSTVRQEGPFLKLIKEITIDVPEPSGLSLNSDYSELWTVSDGTNHIYKLSLEGRVLDELTYEGTDLEGIVYDSRDNSLWVVEERERVIVHVDISGNELSRHPITLLGSGNSGLEGICLDTTFSHFVLNEKEPNLWAKLKNDFTTELQKEINEVNDLSGITFDKSSNTFWIVSDQSSLLFQWNIENGIIRQYNIKIDKAEGVAINPIKQIIYIVSDSEQKLYEFQLIN
ncbi:MAG: SdiA-regulated domain-containing protein [Melioribacteraceae bacterium]|nr:SdiA-regulated domain-containing protein [Melioribacteraceae bacterium]